MSISLRADALVASGSVEALVFTVVLTRSALIEIPTRDTVWVQDVSLCAGAGKASFSVLTREFARRRSELAFVHI